jgi:hypothetical protein
VSTMPLNGLAQRIPQCTDIMAERRIFFAADILFWHV